jgi:hypothetical protein
VLITGCSEGVLHHRPVLSSVCSTHGVPWLAHLISPPCLTLCVCLPACRRHWALPGPRVPCSRLPSFCHSPQALSHAEPGRTAQGAPPAAGCVLLRQHQGSSGRGPARGWQDRHTGERFFALCAQLAAASDNTIRPDQHTYSTARRILRSPARVFVVCFACRSTMQVRQMLSAAIWVQHYGSFRGGSSRCWRQLLLQKSHAHQPSCFSAGVVVLGPVAEVPLAAVRQCFDANVFGLLEVCQVRPQLWCAGCISQFDCQVQEHAASMETSATAQFCWCWSLSNTQASQSCALS